MFQLYLYFPLKRIVRVVRFVHPGFFKITANKSILPLLFKGCKEITFSVSYGSAVAFMLTNQLPTLPIAYPNPKTRPRYCCGTHALNCVRYQPATVPWSRFMAEQKKREYAGLPERIPNVITIASKINTTVKKDCFWISPGVFLHPAPVIYKPPNHFS